VIAVLAWVVDARRHATLESTPIAVMGTDCRIVASGPRRACKGALAAAEQELRQTEAAMSTWIDASELSRFNRAAAGEAFALSEPTLDVLRAAFDVHERSAGAFDVTCRPLIELWRQAGKGGRMPSANDIETARRASSHDMIALEKIVATKSTSSVRVDLGGIAKGYGIDRAIDALLESGCESGLVDVGGDLRCFGRSPRGMPWEVGVRHPSGDGMLARIRVEDAAVCTSADTFRYVEIDGRRFSHIVDPRTGWPAESAASVTVVAPTAMLADAWATALCVAGIEGLALLPKDSGIAAFVVDGTPDAYRFHATESFQALWIDAPPSDVRVVR